MDLFPKFDMVISAPPQLRRTLNKYVGDLTELINMDGWPELIEVLTGYWNSQRMVFHYGMAEITPTLEEKRIA